MNSISYFEIQSSDPTREAEFYNKIFGWKFVRDESIPIEYYRIETDGLNGGLLKRMAKTVPMVFGTNAFVNSAQVQSFDATAKLILDNGGIVALPKFAVRGKCWQGYFLDADGNTFGIFEVDETAK